MGKFVFAYVGGGGMAATPAEQDAVMAAWNTWYTELGAAVADGGAPFAGSSAVSSSGKAPAKAGLTGYTIVNAASLDEAAGFAKGCPIIAAGGSVEVYECMDM